MRQMAGLQRAGKIRSIGLSNYSARQMEKAASQTLQAEGMAPASNQVPISLLDRRIERNGLLAAAQRLGVALIAYSPLAQGLLSGRFHAHPELAKSLPPGRRSRFNPASRAYKSQSLARTKPLIDELDKISKSYGTTISQIALAWLITFYGETVVAIPGATCPEHATDCAVASSLRLTENELARIEEVSAPVARR
jgi:aryl-alcohol dehydrogenase-like predicted oxidoreductase